MLTQAPSLLLRAIKSCLMKVVWRKEKLDKRIDIKWYGVSFRSRNQTQTVSLQSPSQDNRTQDSQSLSDTQMTRLSLRGGSRWFYNAFTVFTWSQYVPYFILNTVPFLIFSAFWLLFMLYSAVPLYTVIVKLPTDFLCSLFRTMKFITQFITAQNCEASKLEIFKQLLPTFWRSRKLLS